MCLRNMTKEEKLAETSRRMFFLINIVKIGMPFLFGSCVGGVGKRFTLRLQLSPASRLRMPLGTKYYLAAFPLCPS